MDHSEEIVEPAAKNWVPARIDNDRGLDISPRGKPRFRFTGESLDAPIRSWLTTQDGNDRGSVDDQRGNPDSS